MTSEDGPRFPLAIDPDRWAAIKDEHQLHPDEEQTWADYHQGGGTEEEPEERPEPEVEEEDFDTQPRRLKRRIIVTNRMTPTQARREREQYEAIHGLDDGKRRLPLTRGGCADVPRPCPHVGCRHHLYLDVQYQGNIWIHLGDVEPEDMVHSCSLDVADKGVHTLLNIASVYGMTREAARLMEIDALYSLRKSVQRLGLVYEDLSSHANEQADPSLPTRRAG